MNYAVQFNENANPPEYPWTVSHGRAPIWHFATKEAGDRFAELVNGGMDYDQAALLVKPE